MKKNIFTFVSIVILAAVAGGGYGYHYMKLQVTQEMQQTISFLEKKFPGSQLIYKSYEINVLSQTVVLNEVSFIDDEKQVYTVNKLTSPINLRSPLTNLEANNIHFEVRNGPVVDIGHSEVINFKFTPGFLKIIDDKIKRVDFSKFQFDNAKFDNVVITSPYTQSVVKIGSYEIRDYGLKRESKVILSKLDLQSKQNNDQLKIYSGQMVVDNLAQMLISASEREGSIPEDLSEKVTSFKLEGIYARYHDNVCKLNNAEGDRNVFMLTLYQLHSCFPIRL